MDAWHSLPLGFPDGTNNRLRRDNRSRSVDQTTAVSDLVARARHIFRETNTRRERKVEARRK